jgi:ZIP family zinc transporter
MSSVQIVLLGAIAGCTIFLGLPFGRLRAPSVRLKAGLNATAIGVLIFLEWDILTHAWDPTDAALANHQWTSALVDGLTLAVGLGLGLVGLVHYEQRITRWRSKHRASEHTLVSVGGPGRPQPLIAVTADTDGVVQSGRGPGSDLALLIACGIGLHNLAEGLAIGNSAASGDLSLALVLIIGFGLHNATEGFGIVAPLAMDGQRPSWRRLALLGVIGGGPTLVGTLIGQIWVNDLLSTAFLSLAAGSVLYVIIELLAVARKAGMKELTAWCLLLGSALGFVTDGILIAAGA